MNSENTGSDDPSKKIEVISGSKKIRSHIPKRRRRKLVHKDRLGVEIYVLPNLITTANMFFGFFGIIRAINGDYTIAAYALVAAAVFDLLDGRVARLTKSESSFGAQYDSLCDLISFGLAPSLLLFLWALQPYGRIGWLACFFYVACGALRLARFNVYENIKEQSDNPKEDDNSFFYGLPIPMAAGIVASAVIAFKDLGLEASKSPIILAATIIAGISMVSNFPYRSFKDVDLRRSLPFHYLVTGVAIMVFVAIKPEITLFILFVSYASLGLLSGFYMAIYRKFFKKKKRV